MKKHVQGILAYVLAMLIMLSSLYATVFAAKVLISNGIQAGIHKQELLSDSKGGAEDNEIVSIVVELLSDEPALKASGKLKTTNASYQRELLKKQVTAQKSLEKKLGAKVNPIYNYSLLFNGFVFKGEAKLIPQINSINGMRAFRAPTYEAPEPKMTASTSLVNALSAWDLGYTGEGTAIAILDTGILLTHEAFSVMPDSSTLKLTKDKLQQIMNQYGEFMHAGKEVDKLYKSDKIPFGWDYQFENYDPKHTASDHGTHVAAIAAGNNGKDFKGVAYDAQLVVMQVFSAEGGTAWEKVMAALEDCAYLGIDSINMSLGSGAGFSKYFNDSFDKVFETLVNAGINVSASAGNEGTTADGNAWEGYQLSSNPDYGTVGSPSTYSLPLSVASSDNAMLSAASIICGDMQFGYTDPFEGTDKDFSRLSGDYDYVFCGLGKKADFDGKDLSGKIALIERGEITFTEKAKNAVDAGAVAVIIYNNVDGILLMSVESTVPVVSILQQWGQKMVEKADANGYGKLTVESKLFMDMTNANVISSFSSRGTTADLLIKPEITAPGGSVTSAVGFQGNSAYETWDGTSMSSPHVAAAMAIVNKYVMDKLPGLTPSERAKVVNAILMSTATILDNENVREQGAGLLNLAGATVTNAYLSVEGVDRPKLELGENDKGEWTFKVIINNFGDEAITYNIDVLALADKPVVIGEHDGKDIIATNNESIDVTADCDITAPEKVTVEAGKSKTIEIKMAAKKALLDFYAKNFPSGSYLEGFVKFVPEKYSDGTLDAELSIPFLGFVGDWDYASMLDRGYYWQAATGEFNWNSGTGIDYNYIGSDKGRGVAVGLNPYVESMEGVEFNPDWGAFSPNDDGIQDYIDYIAFTLLRNARMVYMKAEYSDHTDILYESNERTWRKDFVTLSGYTYCDFSFEFNPAGMSEGETVNLVLETWLDHEDYKPENNESGRWVIPVTYDTVAPVLTIGSNKTINVQDSHYVAYIGVYSDNEFKNLYSENAAMGVFEQQRNKVTSVTGYSGVVYVFCADYAGNGQGYKVDLDKNVVTKIDGNPFYEAPDDREIVWEETWENESTYDYWDTVDADGDGFEWGVYSTPHEAHKGQYWAGSASYDNAAQKPLTPDNWLISKPIKLEDDGGEYTLEFYMSTLDSDEAFGFYIGLDGQNYKDFKSVITEKPFTSKEYTKYSVDLADYAGKTVRFAWRHYDCTDGFFLKLDTIRLYKLPDTSSPYGKLLFGESFEKFPTGWTFVDADGDGYGWDQTTDLTAYHGKGVAYSSSYINDVGALTPDNWLISPEIEIPQDAMSVVLTYFVGAPDKSYYKEKYAIYIGTGTDYTTYELLFSEKIFDPEWSERVINLTEYAGEKVHIALRHYESTDQYIIMVDDFAIYYNDESPYFTVSYYVGEELYTTQDYAVGEAIVPPEDPESPYEGQVFLEWEGLPQTMPPRNIDVYAKFRYVTYEVKFVDGVDGKILKTTEVAHGTIIKNFPFPPEHDGYKFVGWDYDKTPIVSDTVITAMYEVLSPELGDINKDGRIDAGDAVLVLRHVAGLVTLNDSQLAVADFNEDSVINTGDATAILKHVS
jgi:subtilisin family serine protease